MPSVPFLVALTMLAVAAGLTFIRLAMGPTLPDRVIAIDLIGVVPESEAVLHASNQGLPAVHMDGTDVAEAYKDVVARFMGEDKELRFTDYQKPGLLQRLFGTR